MRVGTYFYVDRVLYKNRSFSSYDIVDLLAGSEFLIVFALVDGSRYTYHTDDGYKIENHL